MPRVSTLTFFCLLCLFGCGKAPSETPALSRGGEIVVEPREIVLAYSRELPIREFMVELQNVGGESVKLLRASSSCSCTEVIVPETKLLAPGETSTVSLRVDQQAYGDLDVVVEFECDSVAHPRARCIVRLRGMEESIPRIGYQTESLDLTSMHAGESVQSEIELRTVEAVGSPYWIKSLVSSSDAVSAVLQGPIEEVPYTTTSVNRKYRFILEGRVLDHTPLNVTLTPLCNAGGAPDSRHRTTYYLALFEPIGVLPSEIEVGAIANAKELSLTCVGRDNEEFLVTAVELVTGEERTALAFSGGKTHGLHHRVTLRFPSDVEFLRGDKAIKLAVRTTHTQCPQLYVPVGGR